MGLAHKIISFAGVLMMFICCCVLSRFTLEGVTQEELFKCGSGKKSITFLLGKDKPGYNYFELAELHFLYDEEEKTDLIIKSCSSIEDMINYLNHNATEEPLGTIQVVLHGNPWSGLSLPIINEGPRATKRNLVKAIMNNPLPAIKASSIDSNTKINFWGCGIGKNPFIKIAMEEFFELQDGSIPKIYASPHFVIFKYAPEQDVVKRIKASYWPYFFKRGYRPSDALIESELKSQFPGTNIKWSAAINQEEVEDEKAFQNSFHIPVSWLVIYPTKESRPSVKSNIEKIDWVKSQNQLMDQISALEIPFEKFQWTVNKIIHTKADGTKVPAIKGIGMTTVICVMESS